MSDIMRYMQIMRANSLYNLGKEPLVLRSQVFPSKRGMPIIKRNVQVTEIHLRNYLKMLSGETLNKFLGGRYFLASFILLLSLKSLELHEKISDQQFLAIVKYCTNLKEINISNNRNITCGGIAERSGLSKLTNLILVNCPKIRNADFMRLTVFENLTSLTLSGVNDEGLEYLSGFSKLERLNLDRGLRITDFGLDMLSRFQKLKEVTFCKYESKNLILDSKPESITKEAWEKFQQDYPDIKLISLKKNDT